MMKIQFELIDKETINIIGVNEDTGEIKVVGRIFTPSGTGVDCINAIQVCGFKEAFDLWGCGRFIHPKLKPNDMEYEKNEHGDKKYMYAKDIQLMFDDETKYDNGHNGDWSHNCTGCFNNPCTCERKDKYDNPYSVKREQDLKFLEKIKGTDNKMKTKLRMLEGLE